MIQHSKPSPASAQSLPPDAEFLTVTVPRAAELSGLGISTLWMKMAAGDLEFTKVGRRRLIVYSSLKRLVLGPTKKAA